MLKGELKKNMLIVKINKNSFFVDDLARSYPHPNAEYWFFLTTKKDTSFKFQGTKHAHCTNCVSRLSFFVDNRVAFF